MPLPFFKKREFSDWLNPVLVKELKQSVRSKQFVGVFVLVQLVMILFVTFGLATTTGAQDMQEMSAMFWVIISIYLLGILPMSGLNALAREFDDARLDLLQLSSMSSRGIVLGKWLSLNLQGTLVVLSLLPYIALRYFVGSVNPLHDLATLGWILYGSLILSGAAICASVVRSKIIRIIMLIGGVFALFSLPSFFAFASMSGGMAFSMMGASSSASLWITIPLVLLVTVPVGGLFLEFASARISPPAENHETPKRLYMIAILVVWLIAFLADAIPAFFAVPAFTAMIAVAISSIIKEPINLPGAYQPFVRFGAVGRRLGRLLLYPGWPSGANFCLFLFVISLSVVLFNSPRDADEHILFLTCCLGSLLLPRAITIAFKLHDTGMRLFTLIQLVAVCLAILAMLTEETKGWEVTNILFFVPQAGVLFSLGRIESNDWQYGLFMLGNIGVVIISYGIICVGAWKTRKTLAALEADAAEIVARKKREKKDAIATQAAPVEA